jgi:hypothetical protein
MVFCGSNEDDAVGGTWQSFRITDLQIIIYILLHPLVSSPLADAVIEVNG